VIAELAGIVTSAADQCRFPAPKRRDCAKACDAAMFATAWHQSPNDRNICRVTDRAVSVFSARDRRMSAKNKATVITILTMQVTPRHREENRRGEKQGRTRLRLATQRRTNIGCKAQAE
jgi:hypothetical protein